MSNTDRKIKQKWLIHKAKYSHKQLLINNYQVMQRWEDSYMKELASVATTRGGDVLELGFGMGISAGHVQKSKKIKKHFVVDCHPDVIKRAQKMFFDPVSKGRMILIQSYWEDLTPKLRGESFDGILFDTGPIDKEVEFFHFFPFFEEAYRLLKKGGLFTYFSDQPKEFSKNHLTKLRSAGFRKINYRICEVTPPKSCSYWKHNTIIVPIVAK